MSTTANQNRHGTGFSSIADALHAALPMLKAEAQTAKAVVSGGTKTEPPGKLPSLPSRSAREQLAALASKCALCGFGLHRFDDGCLELVSWGPSRHPNRFGGLGAAYQFLKRIQREGLQ